MKNSSSLLINAAIAHLGRTHTKKNHGEVPQKSQLNESVEQGIILLSEELSEKHKKIIANMPETSGWVKIEHDKVFGKGVQTQEIPYSRENEERITTNNVNTLIQSGGWNNNLHHDFVMAHLSRQGYHVTDYVGGYATKRYDPNAREEKIGKILSKTGADKEMTTLLSKPKYKMKQNEDGTFTHDRDKRGNKIVESEGKYLNVAQAFANDPIRAAKKDVRLVVTRSKEGVAGMSTGKGWRSCMNLDDGCNRHYVPHDVEHGTLTAYLVRKEDTDFDNPVGRVNLKQFSNDEGHKIWRPEEAVYGSMPQAAVHAIKNWSETQYPHKEDTIYSKQANLYNDDGKSALITGNPSFGKIHSHVKNTVVNIANATDENNMDVKWQEDHTDPQDNIDKYLNSLDKKTRNHLAIHHSLTTEDDPIEKSDYDKSSEDFIGAWASRQPKTYSELSDNELMQHLKTAEDASDSGRRYDSEQLSEATGVHARLIHEAMHRHNPEIKDKVISHLVNRYDHPDNSDWYKNMDEEDSNQIPHLHDHTQNSNLLHKLYHIGKSGNMPGIVNSIDQMNSHAAHAFAHAIGKHGDDDFLKEFTSKDYHEHLENEEHHIISGFHKGLNERDDSEEMQHKLIGELNLGSGRADHGKVLDVDSPERAFWAQNIPVLAHEGGIEHPGNNKLYANMAYYTQHPSVHTALKNRNDTQTYEIKEGVRDNVHGLGKQ